MTRPAQKWIGIGVIFATFLLMLFTMAVPYVNHFGDETNKYTYFTRWNGKWKEGQQTVFNDANELFNFPKAAPWLMGLGLLSAFAGAIYLFWLTYINKPCYFLRERPGPIGGGVVILGMIFYLIGSLIYERWATGSPRPEYGWPADNDFLVSTVKLSPTFWFGLVIAFIALALSTMSIVYYLDTVSKRPVK